MKKILLIAVALASVNANATKARLTALGNSFHLVDNQSIYTNPGQINSLGNFVSLESGLTTSTTTRNNAEGAISYGLSETSRIAVAMGRNDDMAQTGRTFMNSIVGAGTYSVPQNALNVVYGLKADEMLYAFGLMYSNFNNKLTGAKETASGLTFAAKKGAISGYVDLGLSNEVTLATTQKFDGGGFLRLAGRYKMDDMSYGLDVFNWTAKSSTAGIDNESYGVQMVKLSAVKSTKVEGNEVFIGGQLWSTAVDCKTQASVSCSTKFTRLAIPVWIGVEANATDWLIMRGSITQSLPLNTMKDDIGLPAAATSGITGSTGAISEYSATLNDTTVAAGVGLKFKSITIDGTITTATTQLVNTTALMSQVGVTYVF